ncbi:hypothetical protein [Actinoplanes sp. NPDC049681]|uniref:hypothetical protein n=1 Tax=Actinoplanes sp. NPDC049681 TaxID=3363905 RepID=UPI00379F6458
MRRKIIMVLGAVLLAGVLPATAPGASAAVAAETSTITLDGHVVQRDRVATPKTRVTGTGATHADFDGDGVDDVAGQAYVTKMEWSSDHQSSGIVTVRYSSVPYTDHFTDDPEGCGFGYTLASGNFNGDKYDDLVIGAPCEPDPRAGSVRAGGIWILPGGSEGLSLDRAIHIDQSTAGVPGASAADDYFGGALATGDLSGDGRDDLAVGAPWKKINGRQQAGSVLVLLGGTTGIRTTGAVRLDQDQPAVPGGAEARDQFGYALAIGKVDKDRYADLVIGTVGENASDYPGNGAVTLMRGAASGVLQSGATTVTGHSAALALHRDGVILNGLGEALAVGDTNGDGYGEVLVGMSAAQAADGLLASGAVISLAGRAGDLSTSGVKMLSQNTAGVPGADEAEDRFGDSIAAGDVTGDGRADLLVGVPGEDLGSHRDAGAAVLLRGSASGLTGTGAQVWNQDSGGVPGAAEKGDRFGDVLGLLNLDGRGGWDAVVAAPGEKISGDPDPVASGLIQTFTATSAGLTPKTSWNGRMLRYTDFYLDNYGQRLAAG